MSLKRCALKIGLVTFTMNALTSQLWGDAIISLYNPVNHGLVVSFSPSAQPLNEFSADRVGVAHATFRPAGLTGGRRDGFPFFPFYVNKEIIDFYQANPSAPSILSEIYEAWEVVNPELPGKSMYENVKISPSAPEAKLGVIDKWGYFDRMARRSSSTAGSELADNGGRLTLTSPNLDTGFGEAIGEITPEGDIKLLVDINRSGGPGFTPVAEAAIEATIYDSFTIDLAQSTAVSANLSVSAKAFIPTLDFSRSNFYSYAVGYQFAIYEQITFGETEFGQFLLNNPDPIDEFDSITPEQAALPAFREYWGASGLYWVDARARSLDPIFITSKSVTIESIGLPVPDMPGVAESQLPVEFLNLGGDIGVTDIPVAFKDIREFSYSPANPGNRLYDDPLMPFDQFKSVENVLLPTNKPLKVALNFFVMAGGSDNSAFPINFFIDGGNTAGFGISVNDPNALIVSDAGFNYRPIAVGIPETSSLVMSSMLSLALAGWTLRRRVKC